MALSVGRGMFTLASAPAERVDSLRLAPLVLQGHTSPKGATIELDTSALSPDHMLWPDFHNGCASALRLAPPGCGAAMREGELGRHWILYSKPRARQHAYAGFLLGLGLQGHLVALANTDVYRFMSQVKCLCEESSRGPRGPPAATVCCGGALTAPPWPSSMSSDPSSCRATTSP
mmetsp:Transcript_19961/g.60592  ORF Transcript_19961/g.60592 Transcript_19961/m.60592 type:complete len:175 (-) Transcript_19961:1148-1672(-)